MELNSLTKRYWTLEDLNLLDNVKTVKDMYEIATRVISRMDKPVIQVCGPITSGGKGDINLNLLELSNKIVELENKGLSVFDQLVFEDATFRLKDILSKDKYFMDVFTYFYLPLFRDGHIDELYFLKGWDSSRGAIWEHEQAQKLGLKIVYC